MLGGAKLTFSYEKICQDVAGLVLVFFIPICVLFWERFSLRPLVVVPAVLISDFLLGLAAFQLTYRGLWRFVNGELKRRLRYSSGDQNPQPSIKSYSELISCWREPGQMPG
jgi:hypothetical protein